MKRFLIAAAVSATAFAAPALAADVGVSVSIGQPGFYGRIDIGDFPPPVLIYRQPILVERVLVDRPPIYLRVPPGHAKHWAKHCYKYNACGERVYFVQDEWYTHEYVPRYRERFGDRHEERHDEGRHEGRGHEKHGHGHDHDD